MIKKLYKRIKTTVDAISTAQKVIGLLLALLGTSLAGNMFQHGIIMGQVTNPPKQVVVMPEKTIIQTKPVYIDRVKIIKEVCPKSGGDSKLMDKHMREWHV